jgi:capsid protein
LILLDFSQTNDSSARAALLQAYRSFRRRQNQTRDRIIQPIYNRLIGRQLAGGRLKLIKDVYHLEFTPPRWAWVDPLKEVLALEKEVAAGAKSLTEWIGETGRVAEAVFNTRAAELVLLQKLGVPTSTVAV